MPRPGILTALTALAVTSAVIEARAEAPTVPVYRSFKDWVIGCDNTRSCTALGLQPDDGETGAFIRVERAGGGSSKVRVLLALFDEALIPGEPVTVAIEGLEDVRPSWPVERREEGYAIITVPEAEVTPFINALRQGRRLSLTGPSGEQAEISLDGATAALLFMDDMQGRVGTVTALVRPGTNPASTVPTPPPPPEVRPVRVPEGAYADPGHARIVRERLAQEEPDACDPPQAGSADADQVLPLGDDKELVSLMCWQGPYNSASRYFRVDGGNADNAQPVRFPAPLAGADEQEGNSITNGFFDPPSGLLGFFGKGRGIGDCGASGEYAWTGERFALVSYQFINVCRLVPEVFWPVLWRADLR